ncbi:MAG: serine hydrolase domain-containing protein [Mangrovibacterium sp.]
MKKRILIPIILFILILLAGAIYINPLLPIMTGYAAKNLASGVFIGDRTQHEMESEDLDFSLIRFTHNKIDYKKKEVTSRFLWGKSKAVYIDGFGCSLIADYPEKGILNRKYPLTKYPAYDSDNLLWPQGNIISDTVPTGVDTLRLKVLTEDLFSDNPSYKGTFGFMAVYKGQVIAERYRPEFSPKTRFLSWSMAKSITNALVGIRVAEGKLNIHQPLNIGGISKKITLNGLLQMNSGLAWNENYGNQSDVTTMLHNVADMGLYAWNKPSVYPEGKHWSYSSGSTNVVCLALRQNFESDYAYWHFPKEQLFDKIGMQSVIFELDASGTFVGSSYIYATLRDYARFGLLYLNNGEWQGKQILPEDWVNYAKEEAKGSEGQYGSSFWLNKNKAMPDVPADALMCKGHDGQFIIILPSQDLVLVRTGYTPQNKFNLNLMIKQALVCIK